MGRGWRPLIAQLELGTDEQYLSRWGQTNSTEPNDKRADLLCLGN